MENANGEEAEYFLRKTFVRVMRCVLCLRRPTAFGTPCALLQLEEPGQATGRSGTRMTVVALLLLLAFAQAPR